MADKKYQVFISSTYADLKEERRKILDILLMADCIPAGMEAFVASDVEQFEVIKKVIKLCDYYILIIGKRYGSINEQTGLSYTEMEYEYAKELGIPVLVFALDEAIEVSPDKMDAEQEKIEALQKFRQKALTNRLATIWKTQDELTGAVAISIMRATKEIQRPGWQRATEYDEASLRREIMEIQKINKKMEAALKAAKAEIASLTSVSDAAFEGCFFDIEYCQKSPTQSPWFGRKRKELPDLFKIIATQMMDVAIGEEVVDIALRRSLFEEDSVWCTFTDHQLVKTILPKMFFCHFRKISIFKSGRNQIFFHFKMNGFIFIMRIRTIGYGNSIFKKLANKFGILVTEFFSCFGRSKELRITFHIFSFLFQRRSKIYIHRTRNHRKIIIPNTRICKIK